MNKFQEFLVLGIANNTAGHMKQAGEDVILDSLDENKKRGEMPKGIFSLYLPVKKEHYLCTYPVSSTKIEILHEDEKYNIQTEPELALICEIEYAETQVKRIVPKRFTAFNDVSIRNKEVKHIAEKKNWGPNSTGVAEKSIEIDRFESGGNLDSFKLVSFLIREEELIQYSIDSWVNSYLIFYQEMLDWVVETINTQKNSGFFDNVLNQMKYSNFPTKLVLAVGGTNYTDYGEENFLKEGDEAIVVLYDSNKYNISVIEVFLGRSGAPKDGMVILRQKVNIIK